MFKGTKYRLGLLPIPFAKNKKIKPTKLKAGLSTLDKLWSKGYLPNDLRKHFYFHWFVFAGGRATRMSKTIGAHRNTMVYLLKDYSGKYNMVIRRYWATICKSHPRKTFPKRFYIFYKKYFKNPVLSPRENQNLVDLWQLGFPEKMLRVHYIYWAFKQGHTMEKISDTFDFDYRTLHRIRDFYSKKESPAYKWLAPLRLKYSDLNPPRPTKYNKRKKK